jgi:uncharacterized protein YcbK (DUF882 family)
MGHPWGIFDDRLDRSNGEWPIGFTIGHFVECNPPSGDPILILRHTVTSFRALLSSSRRVWAVLPLAAMLVLTPTIAARSPRVRGRSIRLRHATMALAPGALLLPGIVPEADSALPEEGRKYELKLYHLHTGESLDVVYRIGDTYIPEAMAELNHFLRDHRTEDQSHYDPSEFDLLHNLMMRLGKPKGVIDIVCGYRTPESNEFLRTLGPSTGVAEHSQHIQAKAIDIRVPGVQTKRLRDAALSLGAGGVGYYPVSQFVHVDVGPVRTWSFGGGRGGARHRRTRHVMRG